MAIYKFPKYLTQSDHAAFDAISLRIPTKPATYSDLKPATAPI